MARTDRASPTHFKAYSNLLSTDKMRRRVRKSREFHILRLINPHTVGFEILNDGNLIIQISVFFHFFPNIFHHLDFAQEHK